MVQTRTIKRARYQISSIVMKSANKPLAKKLDTLVIDGSVNSHGITVSVNDDPFTIEYTKEVWHPYPKELQHVLCENVVLSSTLFLPQIHRIPSVEYRTGRPLVEPFLFFNGIYDMPICAITDEESSKNYLQLFFNTQRTYSRNAPLVPPRIDFELKTKKRQSAIIPFSFGKESLLNIALCQELGLEPVPVLYIEPSNAYEYSHKKKLIEAFEQETGIHIHVVHNGPGILRYGAFWNMKTELGWGLQTTEYAIMSLPIAHAHDAGTIVFGNEQSCNDTFMDKEGFLTYKAGFDQHRDWLSHQTILSSLLLGRRIDVLSYLEPLYELAITHILHHRYPEIGKFQMSCMADSSKAEHRRWCQSCTKCGYIFALCAACGVDTATLGFTENLFDENHIAIYESFFGYDPQNPIYGSQEELGLAFLLASRAGCTGASIDRFNKEIRPRIEKDEERLRRTYLGINLEYNLPEGIRSPLLRIFNEELRDYALYANA